MPTINMLAEQSPFGGGSSIGPADSVNAPPSPFSSTANGFHGDFFGLPLQNGDSSIWGLGPASPPMPWNVKQEPFANSTLDHDLKNAHVRNGQPTPPLYDEASPSPPSNLYYAAGQLDGAVPDLTDPRLQSGIYSDHSGPDSTSGGASGSSSKRRRTRDHQKHRSVATRFDSSDYDDQRHEKAKREKFLERNRLAASKCRQKKKEHTMLLESRYKEQSDKKEILVAEISRLRSEILGLKNEVLKHAQCGDEPIKLHLAQMVKKITYKDTSAGGAEAADAGSTSDSPETPPGQASMSFGFDDPLHLEHTSSLESFDPQLRRESQTSLVSDSSYAFSADDTTTANFDDLINV